MSGNLNSDQLNYDRCPRDDLTVGVAAIGVNPNNDEPIELNIGGVASVIAIQSAMLTLSAAMKQGHEKDFLEKVALSIFGKLITDPHALCPLFTICSFCLLMLQREVGVTFDDDGNVVIASEDGSIEGRHECISDYFLGEDDDDESDETPMGKPGGGLQGGGPSDGGEGFGG